MITLGIDIGGTSVKLALLRDGVTCWTARSRSYSQPTTAELIDAIRGASDGRIGPLDRVGLCVPGALDSASRTVVHSVNVPGLRGVRLDDLLGDSLGIGAETPSVVLTDAFACGYDLYLSRCTEGRLLVLSIGTGVGASVLDKGVGLCVDGESSGHIGQIDVSLGDDDVIGPDGGAGGLEGYIGAAALARLSAGDGPVSPAELSVEDPPLRALVRAIRICHAIYCPQHIYLCGGIGIRLGPVRRQLHRAIATNLTSVARAGWTLDVGTDDFHAARGAAAFAARSASGPE